MLATGAEVEERAMADHPSVPTRIIIADDHPLFRTALAFLLEETSEWEVVAQAADGREALELCRRFRPDLVLMDLNMPKMDGLEATSAVKRELPRTIVLVLTAYEDPEHLSAAIKAGAGGYLLKTASHQQIIETVRRALEGESPLDQELAMELLQRLTNETQEERQEATRSPGSGAPPRQRPTPALLRELTPREVEVLRLLASGLTNQQIAKELLISTSTVKNHIQRILTKLGASDRTQAAVMAIEMELVASL
jgi:DNA-binding NarL/FixJ family response regulator